MGAIKTLGKKKRLGKKNKQNKIVPPWVAMRTSRKVTTHPKRRYWRRSQIKE